MQPAADPCASPIGIAGGGRVGKAFGRLLYEAGEPVVCVAGRSLTHAREAAAYIGPRVEAVGYAELPGRAARVILAVPDSALESVAASLGMPRGILLHTCGSKGPEALRPVSAAALSCGAIHPLQTIPEPSVAPDPLRGIAFAVAGDGPALAWAEHIVNLAHGMLLRIAAGCRPLYHAAAVMASNYIVALVAAARDLLVAAGADPALALQALAPLSRSSLENVLRHGPAAALTGPIERGDLATLAAHLDALAAASKSIERLYRAAGLQAVAIARERGLPAARAADLERMLAAELSRT